MKDRPAAIVALAVVAILVLVAWKSEAAPAAPEPASRQVSVAGEAEVRVVPDEVVLTLGIETHDDQLAVAKGQNDAIVKKVLALASEWEREAFLGSSAQSFKPSSRGRGMPPSRYPRRPQLHPFAPRLHLQGSCVLRKTVIHCRSDRHTTLQQTRRIVLWISH